MTRINTVCDRDHGCFWLQWLVFHKLDHWWCPVPYFMYQLDLEFQALLCSRTLLPPTLVHLRHKKYGCSSKSQFFVSNSNLRDMEFGEKRENTFLRGLNNCM